MMKKYILPFFMLLISISTLKASASRDDLGSIFTAESDYLERLRGIKESCESPDHFSPLLAELATEIVGKVRSNLPKTANNEMFGALIVYALKEISQKTLTLNRLNYLTFQLAVAMNPTVSSSHNLFEGVDLLIQSGIWQLPYDEALKAVNTYIATDEELSTADPTEFKSPQNLVVTIFRPCDRGQWVFPLVTDNPIYGLKTYSDAFAEGISMTGLPLKAENCGVHAGLIKSGEFVYFLFHDLLHNQTLAPSLDPVINEAHVGAMTRVTGSILKRIPTLSSLEKRKKAYGILFWINHELVDYSKEGVTLFTGKETDKEVATAMLAHSRIYVDHKINPALDSRKTYYPYYQARVEDDPSAPFIGDKPFTTHNEDGSAETYVDELYRNNPMDIKNKFVIRVVDQYCDEQGLECINLHLYTHNIFYSFPVQRAFVYSQALLMKYMGADNGQGTYGVTPETFIPSVANKMMMGLLNEFEKQIS